MIERHLRHWGNLDWALDAMTVSSVKGAEGNLKAEAEDQIWPELKSPVRTGGSAA